MSEERTYPEGVPSWIDIEHQDVEAAQVFYGGLFGWTFTEAAPAGTSSRYVIAKLNGLAAAGIGGPARPGNPALGPPAWNTYVAVTDADATATVAERLGGTVLGRTSFE